MITTINCILIEDEPLALSELIKIVSKIPILKLKGSYSSPLKALAHFNGNDTIELVISDIQMPDIKGTEFLKSLSNPPLFIFITADPSFAVESFTLNVVDYIMKPPTLDRLLKAINKAIIQLNHKPGKTIENTNHLNIRDGHKNLIISYDDIQFFEGKKDYVSVVTPEKAYMTKTTMKNLLSELDPNQFMQIHKSYIVNVKYVRGTTASKVIMKGSSVDLPFGEQFKKEVLNRFNVKN